MGLAEDLALVAPGLAGDIGTLITILKAVGVAFIIYVVYSIIMAVVNIKRLRILYKIEKRMDVIEKKINSIYLRTKKK